MTSTNTLHLNENEYRTVCPYDCPDCCSIIATVKNGKVLSVRGDYDHPRTQGFLCRKMVHYEEMINHPDRILYPMKRTGKKGEGLFSRISWDEAIETITKNWRSIIQTDGAEAILPYSYAGTEGIVHENCGEAFFHYMGASKLKRTICSSGKGAGWEAIMGDSLGMPSHRLKECDRILVWGSNIAATRIHEIPYIRQARENGARVTLIDVYASPAVAYCDDSLIIKPGTDGALALSMIHVMENAGLTDRHYIQKHVTGYDKLLQELDRYTPAWAEKITGIPAKNIEELALSYGRSSRAGILLGSGPARRRNGGMMTRCIAALPAVSGQLALGFGICGLSQTGKWGDKNIIKRPDFDKNGARTINMMQLASALNPDITNNPPVKSLYVYSSNPLMITTKQAQMIELFQREDLFTVVHERFLTDTAKYADIILPATFSTEVYDIFHGYGFNGVQYSKKISDIPGECLSNWDVFCKLAKAMGFEESFFEKSQQEICEDYLHCGKGQLQDLSAEEWDTIMDGRVVNRPLTVPMPVLTDSGKIMLYNPALKESLIRYDIEEKEEVYPLHLIAAPSLYTLNSTFTSQNNLTDKRGKMTLLLSATDAAKRNIQNDDIVECFNDLASVRFYAKICDDIAEGTVVCEGVYTIDQSINGKTMNALIGERLSDLGEATTMNDNSVEVRSVKCMPSL